VRSEGPDAAARNALRAAIHAEHPRFGEAILADAKVALLHRGEPHELRRWPDCAFAIARLAWVSDAFLGQVLYRAKARLQALRVPILPRIAHRLAIAIAQISIGDPVIVRPGVYIVHGQVIVDGLTRLGSDVVLAPFVVVGLRSGNLKGPTIEDGVQVGTGAKILGPVRVGSGARIGANAVVISDVPAEATVVGAPAHPV
jgi:serine O-acetyltransferase